MFGVIFGLAMSAAKMVWEIAKKILCFTGLNYSLIALISTIVFHETVLQDIENVILAEILAWILMLILIAGAASPIIISFRNIMRLRNPYFTYDEFISNLLDRNKEKKAENPNVSKEMKSSNPKGFVFGKKNGAWVTKEENKDGHILVIGGAGSGKSSCLAIPSLMSWQERIFAIDIKGELSKKTLHCRPNAKIFNPASPDSVGYDPYYLLHDSDNQAQDAREIALAIIPTPEKIQDPFWVQSAQNLFTAAILHCFSMNYSFIGTMEKVQTTPALELVEEISNSASMDARMFNNQFIGLDAKTISGISTELANHIMVFATDNQIKRTFSKREIITPNDLERGIDIYISIEESKIEQWKGILTLIVNQFLKHCERRNEETATPILFLLDEFARLGKIPTIISGLATLRSKKITIAIITQSLAQLDAIYAKEYRQIIADNCQYKAILNATDADTQEYFSKLVGTYEKTKRSNSAQFEQYTGMGKGTGVSQTTEEKRIIKPEQFAYLTDLVLLSPAGYFRVDKSPYYLENIFKTF